MSSVQDRLVAIVTSSPGARRDVDIEIAIPWLRKKSELLQKLQKDTLKDVIKHCGYKKAVKDDVIITQGELGDCFYIMLTGRMSVFIDTTRSDDEAPPEDKKTSHGGGSSSPASNNEEANKDEDEDDDGDKEEKESGKPLNRSQFGKFIMYFEAGNSFGEIALISDNCVRNATIIADMDSDLLIIHRDLFNTYIKASQVAEYEERRKFVNKCPMFQGWNSKFKGLLEMSLRKEAYPYGSVIVQQGTPVEGLVFIISGQAKINMDPSRHESQYEGLMSATDSLVRNTKADKALRARNHATAHERNLTSSQISVRRKYGYAAAERRVMTKNVDVCCIEKDDLIGAVEMVMEMDTCMETVVSTAATTVFILNAKNYDRLITRKHPITTVRLTQWAVGRISTWCKSSVGSSIRLLKTLEKELKSKLPKPPPPAKRVEVLQKREVVMHQLLDMFRQDKAPLIEPCVPNALFYRIKSAQKTKALMEKPYAQLRSLKNISDFGKIRRKVPRSIMQLKNNIAAERELLKDDRRELYDTFDTRPNTAVGFSRSLSSKSPTAAALYSRQRPKSAIVQSLRIKECGDEQYDFGSSSRDHPDTSSRLDIETVAEIYEEMEQVTKENQENRMRIICSASAKRELKDNLAKSKSKSYSSGSSNGLDKMGDLFQTEYFDWETSEENLKDLENRVDAFCQSVCPQRRPSRVSSARTRPGTATSSSNTNLNHIINSNSNSNHNNKAITVMKRFEIEDPSTVPLPGGTVFVHKKPCRFPHAVLDNPAVHRHVRRFILSQDPDWLSVAAGAGQHSHWPGGQGHQ